MEGSTTHGQRVFSEHDLEAMRWSAENIRGFYDALLRQFNRRMAQKILLNWVASDGLAKNYAKAVETLRYDEEAEKLFAFVCERELAGEFASYADSKAGDDQ